MGTLTLCAIDVDDMHQWFGASDPLVDELRQLAQPLTARDDKPPLIGKIGPLFKHPTAPIMTLPKPSDDDVNALLEGRSVPADRVVFAWVIVRHWMRQRGHHWLEVELDNHQLAVLDFSLVSGGLSSQFSFETVLARDPHLPLLPRHGLTVGWMPSHHVAKAVVQWPNAFEIAAARPEVADAVDALRGFAEALGDGQPSDVVALYQQ